MLRSEEFEVQRQIKEAGGLAEIDEAIELLSKYVEPNYCYYKSKNLRLDEWHPDRGELYEIVLAAFTITICNPNGLTYQAACGMLAGRVPHKNQLDRIKTVAEVIAIISKTGLINVNRRGSGQYIMIDSDYNLDEIPELAHHEIMVNKIPELDSNWHEDFGSLLLGGRHNHHNENTCLDHINRMNSIQLKLNRPFLRKYEEAPTYTFTDKDGHHSQKKADQWKYFITNSYRSYIKLVRGGNRFYLNHKYDKRGRCYAVGYHINTQGSSFKKAIVQLAQAELVEG